MKTGLYANLSAGRKGKELARLMRLIPQIYITDKVEDIDLAIKDIKRDGIKLLFIYGGDGTCHQFLTAWYRVVEEEEVLPKLVLLRGGTMNIASVALGAPRDSLKAVRRVLAAIKKGEKKRFRPVFLLKVSGSAIKIPLYGLQAVLGPAVYFLQEYERRGKGFWLAIKIFILGVCSILFGRPAKFRGFLEMMPCRAAVDTVLAVPQDFSIIYCSVFRRIIFGFRPFIEEGEEDGKYNFLAYAVFPLVVILRLLLLAMGIVPKHPEYLNGRVERLLLRNLDNGFFTMDGDIYPLERCLNIEAGPKARFFDFRR